MKVRAPLNSISSTLSPAHYVGFIVSNVGNNRANNIDTFFNLEFPGDSFSLETTYSTRASVSITETPIIGQKGQLVEIDHIDPGAYEIVVVGRIDTTSSGNYEGESDKNTFSFYSLNYDEINEPIRKVDRLSFYQIRRALKSKSYSSEMKTIAVPFEILDPDGKTDVSTITGVANTCVKSLPDTPWFKKDGWLF